MRDSELLALASARLSYDPQSGNFVWKCGARQGRQAGCVKGSGYLVVGLGGRLIGAHRLAWLVSSGALPAEAIDHINGDKLDNRLSNLRSASRAVNAQNLRRAHADSASGLLGAVFHRQSGRFRAEIRCGRTRRSLGLFDSAEAAHAAYVAAKRQLHEGGTI